MPKHAHLSTAALSVGPSGSPKYQSVRCGFGGHRPLRVAILVVERQLRCPVGDNHLVRLEEDNPEHGEQTDLERECLGKRSETNR